METLTKYEVECEKIQKDNALLLKEFEAWLKKSGLKEISTNAHVDAIDFYIRGLASIAAKNHISVLYA